MRSFGYVALLGATLAATSCGAGQEPTPCGESVDLTVSTGPQPVFTWVPACGVAMLSVSRAGGGAVWAVAVTTQRNTIASGVRYGERPTGTRQPVAPQPLEVGREYDVDLIVAESGADGSVQLSGTGLHRFTVAP